MGMVDHAKLRSTCKRRQVGAVIARDNRILTTGYNGAPPGFPHCEDIGCLREQRGVPSGERHELCMAIHAEQNAIIQAAKQGICIDKATLYVTNHPCCICAKMIISAGIIKIVYGEDYDDTLSKQILEQSGIELIKFIRDGE
jgi:dCMP deaminase